VSESLTLLRPDVGDGGASPGARDHWMTGLDPYRPPTMSPILVREERILLQRHLYLVEGIGGEATG
jgi:hypothetical protein